jgi:hypothetical protein
VGAANVVVHLTAGLEDASGGIVLRIIDQAEWVAVKERQNRLAYAPVDKTSSNALTFSKPPPSTVSTST